MKKYKLKLAVQRAVKSKKIPSRAKFKKWARAALASDANITIRIVGKREGRKLNRDYRGKNYATNVLTFPLTGSGIFLQKVTKISGKNYAITGNPELMGDIVLCHAVVKREAKQQNKSLKAHYAHLLVHAVLHLQGCDHETDEEAIVMEALETQIVTKLGYADPYAEMSGN
ncbi:MAG: rRNA maturation RNase YbeY [Methylobacillus sp.]|jgi:probable rRNA maturation factor|nr:rRNA maturation RNase YbeY [Methylobacillus sp.]